MVAYAEKTKFRRRQGQGAGRPAAWGGAAGAHWGHGGQGAAAAGPAAACSSSGEGLQRRDRLRREFGQGELGEAPWEHLEARGPASWERESSSGAIGH